MPWLTNAAGRDLNSKLDQRCLWFAVFARGGGQLCRCSREPAAGATRGGVDRSFAGSWDADT
jgi:hypothetical protein